MWTLGSSSDNVCVFAAVTELNTWFDFHMIQLDYLRFFTFISLNTEDSNTQLDTDILYFNFIFKLYFVINKDKLWQLF